MSFVTQFTILIERRLSLQAVGRALLSFGLVLTLCLRPAWATDATPQSKIAPDLKLVVASPLTLPLTWARDVAGVRYVKAVSAPYRGVRFVPTGGVTPANLAEYLSVPSIVACGGTWIAPADAIAAHRWDAISAAAAEAMAIARSVAAS